MTTEVEGRLQRALVVPLVHADNPETAVQITRALIAGGLTVVEVMLRTPEALACLLEVASSVPEACVGAGTVLTADQARDAIDAGAAFIVSPGLDDGVVDVAQSAQLPIYPGIASATEAQHAWNLGLRSVKFFPAGQAGGTAMLKALSSVFSGMRFMPTGGVSAGNLAEYLAIPAVLACGGSWLTPKDAIEAGDFEVVTKLASSALEIAQSVRG
jgi:2-dehydro-3-deoxyphosphogluconate aldolase/(4S)-4-hydroxy-2-oxoglutarate aldolase